MNPIQTYIQERAEEFEKNFPYNISLEYCYYYHDIKAFNAETIVGVLKLVKELVESLKKRKKYIKDNGEVVWVVQNTRYTQALSDLLSALPTNDTI